MFVLLNYACMKSEYDYQLLPETFAHCLNEQCERADGCLRRQAALRMPAERGIVTIVNPAHITPTGEDCSYFKADCLLRFARGITHLLDQVPHSDAVVIKQQLLSHFGRTHFYRFWRKERLLSPGQQEYIRQLFLKRGISGDPVFDEYVEQYEW